MEHTYEQLTYVAARAIAALTEQSRGNRSEDNQSWWDMARGVVHLWQQLAGDEARAVDRERLQLLLDDIPGVDDEGEGNWRETPVVRL